MIRPRKVVTRRQYDRWAKQKQFVESICGGGTTTHQNAQSTRSSATTNNHRGTGGRRIEVPMPLSPSPSDDTNNPTYQGLEIYDTKHINNTQQQQRQQPTSMKRRRTPSRVDLYRRVDLELELGESSSKDEDSTYTGGTNSVDDATNSFSFNERNNASIFSNEDATTTTTGGGGGGTIWSYGPSESFNDDPPTLLQLSTSTKKQRKKKIEQKERSHSRHTNDAIKHKNNRHEVQQQPPVKINNNDLISPINNSMMSPTSIDVSVPKAKESTRGKRQTRNSLSLNERNNASIFSNEDATITTTAAGGGGDDGTIWSYGPSESFNDDPPTLLQLSTITKKQIMKTEQKKSSHSRHTNDAIKHDNNHHEVQQKPPVKINNNDLISSINNSMMSPTSIDVSVPKAKESTRGKRQTRNKYSDRPAQQPPQPQSQQHQVDSVTNATEELCFCCDYWPSFLRYINKPAIRRYPGMPLSEERELWRSILEGDIWANHYQYIRKTKTDISVNQQVDQIEVVPVDRKFLGKSSDNNQYAESDNVGMLFVPTDHNHQQHEATSGSPRSSNTTVTASPSSIPWWKRDAWKLSPSNYTRTPGSGGHANSEIKSRAKFSVQTKKISNRTQEVVKPNYVNDDNNNNHHDNPSVIIDIEPITVPTIVSLRTPVDDDATGLNPRISPIRLENVFSNDVFEYCSKNVHSNKIISQNHKSHSPIDHSEQGYDEEMIQFHDENVPRPFQVYTAKVVPCKDDNQTTNNNSDIESVSNALKFPIPHLNHSKNNHANVPTPIVETVIEEDGDNSILTDLSEMIRKVDERQLIDKKNHSIIHCEDTLSSQQQHYKSEHQLQNAYHYDETIAELDQFHSSSKHFSEENVEPVGMHSQVLVLDEMIEKMPCSPKSILKTDHSETTGPRPKQHNIDDTNPDRRSHEQRENQTKNEREDLNLFSENEVQTLNPTDSVRKRRDFLHQNDRGRRNDLIDLTNLREPSPSIRKRSKSPIRLYGDPPVPVRMDGSPVRRRSKSPLQKIEPRYLSTMESPTPRYDSDFAIVQNTLLGRSDIIGVFGGASPTTGHHTLPDGSKIVVLKPVVNIYKMHGDEVRPSSPWKSESNNQHHAAMSLDLDKFISLRQKNNLVNSPKVSLQIRTVVSPRENICTPYADDNPDDCLASPAVTVSLDDDDSSIDDELRKLAASEKLLRKELEEVQKRSAVRRWEIDETAQKEKDHQKYFTRRLSSEKQNTLSPTRYRHQMFHDNISDRDLNSNHTVDKQYHGWKNHVRPSQLLEASSNHKRKVENSNSSVIDLLDDKNNSELRTTSSLIDLSCIDIELGSDQPLVSPLPIASAHHLSSPKTMNWRDDCSATNSPVTNDFSRERFQNTNFTFAKSHITPRSLSYYSEDQTSDADKIACSPIELPQSLSGLSQRLWNVLGRNRREASNQSPECGSPSPKGSEGLFVPSLSRRKEASQQLHDSFIHSKYSPVQTTYSRSRYDHELDDADEDVILDRDPSWGTIEKLYQLTIQNESNNTNMSPDDSIDIERIRKRRNIDLIRRNISQEIRTRSTSYEMESSSTPTDALYRCIERADSLNETSRSSPEIEGTVERTSYASSYGGSLTDVENLDVETDEEKTTDQSFYGSLLQFSPRELSHKDDTKVEENLGISAKSSPRIKALLHRQKHRVAKNGNIPSGSGPSSTNETNDFKSQNIYNELVRRSRKDTKVDEQCKEVPLTLDTSEVNSHKNAHENRLSISPAVKRFAQQSSPAKRLERLRQLNAERKQHLLEQQQPQQQEVLSPFERRLSPARRRVSKSLKQRSHTSPSTRLEVPSKNDSKSASTMIPSIRESMMKEGVVQVYMPVTRGSSQQQHQDAAIRKIKTKINTPTEQGRCDGLSVTSSTRSNSLINSFPSGAKARNVSSGKPGSLLWKATAERELLNK